MPPRKKQIRTILNAAGEGTSREPPAELGHSEVQTPLTKLTQKAAKFQWTDACERSFEELKDRLTSAPVLTLPEGLEGYVVYCDASGVRLGACIDAAWYRSRLCVPDVVGLRRQILEESHYSHYSVHLGATKMYHDLKLMY
ncbi:uncharacterized protein LOC132046237 [Lycium ferocissimum]|uniref:uncharacterized protein LOC132046237 n=1 Tax=Lycium ferocissimum TaxID=112874 RepID=UPI0028156C6D|nr:uncharacterized protein LOC132046237 [Lycium ferocissimum]